MTFSIFYEEKTIRKCQNDSDSVLNIQMILTQRNNVDIDTLIILHKHSYYCYINSLLGKANTLFTKIDRSYCSIYRIFKERKNMRERMRMNAN